MGSGNGPAAGPDLASGIDVERLQEGEPFVGRLGDESVVLVRHGEEVFAVGGTCTHYGGPLGEGVVSGETIRCPWHHACFSLRSGEAVGAPALNPVPGWRVEVLGGRAYLRERREQGPLADRGRRVGGPDSVVIVGAGAAGSAAAEMLRRLGYRGAVTMVDTDAEAPYDRPNLSKDYLAGNAPEEWIPLRPPRFYQEHGIERVVARADRLDPTARRVRLSDGQELGYGALLLATGARPIRLPNPGADLPHVHILRSLQDCRRIIEGVGGARRVVILGASFIGMESAASIRQRGAEVVVVAPEAVPFERTLGAALGRALQDAHEANGVEFRLGRTAASISSSTVRLDDGSLLPADLVLVGVGVRPDVLLAEEAGLAVEDGVLVDGRLETSAPGVFAAGDIARYPEPITGQRIRVEHWVAAQRQGQAAARSILGSSAPFSDPPFFWTRQWEVGISYVGWARQWEEVRVEGDLAAGDATVTYIAEGRTLAVATVGRDRASLEAEIAMEKQASSSVLIPGRGA